MDNKATNLKLNPLDIDALLADRPSEPKEAPVPAPAGPVAVAADPNERLSQEEVADLLASLQAAEKAAAAAPPPADPNAVMSQDDIAALFASLQADEETAPQSEAPPAAADAAAAYITTQPQTPAAPPPAPEPAAAPEPAGTDPGMLLSQEEIERLLADLGPPPAEAPPPPAPEPAASAAADAETPPGEAAAAAPAPTLPDEAAPGAAAPAGTIRRLLAALKAAWDRWRPRPQPAQAAPAAATDSGTRRLSYKVIAAALLLLLPLVVLAGYYLGLQQSVPPAVAAAPKEILGKKGVAFSQQAFVEYAERGNLLITGLFLEAGMAPNAVRAFDGYTPLIAAAEAGRLAVAELLLQHGADPNAADREKQTALMRAAAAGRLDLVRLLSEGGADLNRKDKLGQTALRHALNRNQGAAAQLLRSLGALEEGPKGAASSAAAPPPRQAADAALLLDTGQAGPIRLGLGLAGIRAAYPEGKITPDEVFVGDRRYQVLNIYPEPQQSTPSLSVTLTPGRAALSIDVYAPAFRTSRNIGVGSTLGELKQAHPLKAIRYLDGSFLASVNDSGLVFELGVTIELLPQEWLQGKPETTLPDGLKISRILIQ